MYLFFGSISSLIQISLKIRLWCTYKNYITFLIDPPLMMAQNRAESTWEINNYGKYINQFLPNIIKSIRQYEWINRKICR